MTSKLTKGLERTIDDVQNTGKSVTDGVISHAGVASSTVVGTLVKGGVDTAVGVTEVGSNILGALGEGFGGALNEFAGALGIPTPSQLVGGTTGLLVVGGVVVLVLVLIYRNRAMPASPPPPTAGLPV